MRKSRRRSLPKKTKSKVQKKKINDKFATKRKRKKKSHRRGGPSISWQALGMTSPIHNTELAAAAIHPFSNYVDLFAVAKLKSHGYDSQKIDHTSILAFSSFDSNKKKFNLCIVMLNNLSCKRLDNWDWKQPCDRNMGFLIINLLHSLSVDQI